MMRSGAAALLMFCATAQARNAVTIYRDTYGVPHIYGKTDADTAFGLMYAQAEDNFWQLEEGYIRVLGRSAELDGPRGLSSDVMVRAWEGEKRAREHYARADAKLRALCDGFAAGVNSYIKEHPEEFRIETQTLDPALDHPELRLTVDEAEDVAGRLRVDREDDVVRRLRVEVERRPGERVGGARGAPPAEPSGGGVPSRRAVLPCLLTYPIEKSCVPCADMDRGKPRRSC